MLFAWFGIQQMERITMSTATSKQQAPACRTFAAGDTVYVADAARDEIHAGTVVEVTRLRNGYPATTVTLPTLFNGARLVAAETLLTLEGAQAQVAERKLVSAWLNR